MSRDWRLFLEDMIDFAESAVEFTKGTDRAELERNRVLRDAVLRNLELLGEAAKGVPDDVRARAPEVPWSLMIRLRDRLAHAYFRLDPDVLWSTISTDVPDLLPRLRSLRDAAQGASGE